MSAQLNALQIKAEGLGACLKANVLSVPKYQRAYAWNNDNVLEFLTDINTAFTASELEYFLGSVVLQGGDQKYEVVDGQQRLTTASIFIVAVRDFLKGKGQEQVATSLESEFLVTVDTWQQLAAPKLSLSAHDNAFFRASILKVDADPVAPSRESHERLLDAYQTSKKFVEEFAAQTTNWHQRLQGLVQYLQHKVKIIQVVVPTEANAYVVFETLNDRGKDLSASDLLKNHLFGKAGPRIDEVQAKWNHMLGTLELYGGDDLVIAYIRQLWSATREVAREKELFARIKERIATPSDAVGFSDELQKYARQYAAMFNVDDVLWTEFGQEAKATLRSLNTLKLERYRPALLAVLCNFHGAELTLAMRHILNGSVRYLISIGAGGGVLEAAYSEAARKIFKKEITTAGQFAKELQKIIPNDETFRTSFQAARLSKAYIARYFLLSLERAARGESNCELVPNDQSAEVNLEHVLPEHPSGDWLLDPDVTAAYYRRIGNMVLMKSEKNSQIGNLEFALKQPVLAESSFLLTKEVAKQVAWGPAEIDARQAKLADLAVKVWSF